MMILVISFSLVAHDHTPVYYNKYAWDLLYLHWLDIRPPSGLYALLHFLCSHVHDIQGTNDQNDQNAKVEFPR